MKCTYKQLSQEERNLIHRGLVEQHSLRAIARRLCRSVSTISREVNRNGRFPSYGANLAHCAAQERRRRGSLKLVPDGNLWPIVSYALKAGCSPEQIAGRLRREYPDNPSFHVSHETIYCAIYATPRGEIRKELIASLRKAHKSRMPRSRGNDRRGALTNMRSIHERPDEAIWRQAPGHWEGDLIKGAGNHSAVGTLVERTSRLTLLVKMNGCTANDALEAFTRKLRHVPACVRKSLTYDQGKEMAHHEQLSKRLKIDIFFADPHSPWQRPSNENMNGFVREYLPKGIDLSQFSQTYLNRIENALNHRPRKILGFATPYEVFSQHIKQLNQRVALQT